MTSKTDDTIKLAIFVFIPSYCIVESKMAEAVSATQYTVLALCYMILVVVYLIMSLLLWEQRKMLASSFTGGKLTALLKKRRGLN